MYANIWDIQRNHHKPKQKPRLQWPATTWQQLTRAHCSLAWQARHWEGHRERSTRIRRAFAWHGNKKRGQEDEITGKTQIPLLDDLGGAAVTRTSPSFLYVQSEDNFKHGILSHWLRRQRSQAFPSPQRN